jgi:hypothetical protein
MHMTLHKVLKLRSFLALLAVALFASALLGQDRLPSRFDVFTGYSWLHPGYSTYVPNAQENIAAGYTISGTYFFNRNIGFGVDWGDHRGCCCPQIYTITAGPTVRFPMGRVTPFVHALAGHDRMVLPSPFRGDNDYSVIAGGGVDVSLMHHVSLRIFQADWEYAQHEYGALLQPTESGLRLSTGFVWQFGTIGAARVFAAANASCSVQPSAVNAGEPVTVTATTSGFDSRRTVAYNWSSTVVKVSGTSASTQVDTTGLAPGTYTVNATAVDNGRGAHQRSATCQASFTVNPLPIRGPSLTVSANPSTVMCGDSSTITPVGSSPDNSPLTYSCTATSGHLNGAGPIYTLDTAGVPASTIPINCTVTDARNLTASASTSVRCNVAEQKVPVKFGSIDFKNCDQPPTRVDNAAKDELGRYAEALMADPDAKGVVVGYATPAENTEKKGKMPEFAAERSVNTKEYLAVEPVNPTKVDADRIQPRTGTGDDQRVDLWIVPAGVTFPADGTTVVDENHVKAVPRGTFRKETRKDCK